MAKKSVQKKISEAGNDSAAGASNDETAENEETCVGDGDRVHFKRVRHCDSDRALVDFSVDMPKISRYLMAVKNARARALFRIVEHEKSEEQNLAWIRPICDVFMNGTTLQWRKSDEKDFSESSFYRWICSHSIEFEVRGSVPANFQGFSFPKAHVSKKAVGKEPRKRGRPRKNPQSEESAKEPPKPRGRPPKAPLTKFEKPITLNERLHSLVDERIAQRSRTKQNGGGVVRCTNNSLNASLEVTDQLRNLTKTSASFKIPKKHSETPQRNATKMPVPTFQRPKVEPSDFELPDNFRGNATAAVRASDSSSSPVSVQPSHHNPFHWAADRPGTSSPVTARPPLRTSPSKANRESTLSKPRSSSNNFEASPKTNESLLEKETHNKRGAGDGAAAKDLGGQRTTVLSGQNIVGEDTHSFGSTVSLPIFTARSFQYDVDVSPAVVKRFESAQVVDIFDILPPPVDPRLKEESVASKSRLSCTRNIDRLGLRQGKCQQRTAQAFFCGGPLSALAICPRPTKRGRELLAISTFSDETMLNMPTEEKGNCDAFVQLWSINPKELNETARFECLLRIPKARHISALNWCPIIDEDFDFFRKHSPLQGSEKHIKQRTHKKTDNPSTSQQSFDEMTKDCLGMLAVGTHNGQINIYSVLFEIETFISEYQSDVCRQDTNTLPLVLESDPFLTLRHPSPMSMFNGNVGTKNAKERKSKCNENDEEERADNATTAGESPTPNVNNSDIVIPFFCVSWSTFSGARHIGAVSAIGRVYIWDLTQPALPTWNLHFDDWNSPPHSICWLERDKICVSFRRRLFRIYGLTPPSVPDKYGSFQPILECDLNKTCGAKCCSQPLIFPGLISYESATFSYFGTSQQAPSYIWVAPSADSESEKDQICATTLSNCHQIQNIYVSVCQLAGLCASVGADGRLACSLNGRMVPNEEGDGENLMHGRTLLQLIMHDKSKSFAGSDNNNQQTFCFSHNDCCNHRRLEVRLGDCALMDQENERVCRRRAPEVCPGRRLESLTICEFSRRCAGLIYCGGESGLVFTVPCTL